jgi:hypothetical protein
MHEWFKRWLRTITKPDPPAEVQLELPFDPPLRHVPRNLTTTRSTQENI